MVDERAIQGHQLQLLELALRQEKPVKRIARLRFRIDGDDHVPRFDRQNRKPDHIR